MFIEKEDLYTAICEYQLQNITTSAVTIRMAILAAIDEARSYLNAKYDCEAIFSATGEDRHATLLEHCKNIAVWNLCRRANTDLIFEQVSEYRRAAIDWPGLPLLKTEDGEVRITARMGSRRKFRHGFDD